MDAFFSTLIGGVVASLVIQLIKKYFGFSELGSKLATVAVAIAFGTAFYFLQGTQLLESIVQILGISSAVYALFLKKTEN